MSTPLSLHIARVALKPSAPSPPSSPPLPPSRLAHFADCRFQLSRREATRVLAVVGAFAWADFRPDYAVLTAAAVALGLPADHGDVERLFRLPPRPDTVDPSGWSKEAHRAALTLGRSLARARPSFALYELLELLGTLGPRPPNPGSALAA
jgi:hypothetical protein